MLYSATFDINPVAASRPRVTTKGHSYYSGPYKKFRTDMKDLTLGLTKEFTPLVGPLVVDLDLYVQKPKNTKLFSPRGDIDNYVKAVLDQFNKILWEDDAQITVVYAMKAWTSSNEEEGWFDISIERDNNFTQLDNGTWVL
jgi:Holliday junction resolvase RusA-like endonuclease